LQLTASMGTIASVVTARTLFSMARGR
jgi:hypothetical protein